MTFVVIAIPFFIVKLYNADNFSYVSNIYVRVKDEKTGNISNVVLEEYIAGVLAGEMPISFEVEALKAQAVAARSYVLKQMGYNKNRDYDVVNTVTNQVYLSDEYLHKVWQNEYDTKINKIKKAVSETYNEYLEYNGNVAEAMFFSTSVGYTENSEEVFANKVPYLRSVASSWDEISPVYTVKYNMTLSEFYQKLNLEYSDNLNLQVIDKTSTGRIKKIIINGVLFDGDMVKQRLNLKSNYFNIVKNDKNINITTKGYGHGVGMSQYGAQAMALQGYKYDEILSYYYNGTVIKKI